MLLSERGLSSRLSSPQQYWDVELAIRELEHCAKSNVAADWKVRARAPVKANTLRGASPRQAERSPACNRRLLRCGNTRWRAAGGEQPVRNNVTC